MSTISQIESLSPIAQIHQYFESLGSILTSVCESTDTAFRRVTVSKRDADGNIKFYNVKDKQTGEQRRVSQLTYIEDVKSGNLYLDEDAFVVATKCAMIFCAAPFYAFGEMSWHLCKTPIEVTTLAIDVISKVGQQLILGRFYEAALEIGYGTIQVLESLGSGLFEIVKAPIFGFGMQLAAVYGVIKPYHGRKIEALIENAWQKGAHFKQDFRDIPARPGENCWQAFVKDVKDSRPLYLAYCFQVRSNVNNPRIIIVNRQSL
jgi:hypothetical protein